MKYLSLFLLLTSTSALSESTLNNPIDEASKVNSKPVNGQITFRGKIMQEPCALNVRDFSVKKQKKSNNCVEYTAEKIEVFNERTVESASVLIVSYI
ncbi:hypothetical protein ACPV5U_22370 [Vibrio mediterranei]|jgi:type 1 fimbria pilin|uniref:Type 1 fimbrial protein n=1 Tax=Vibrio barjaei TaxID=1676683 RepID=A0ABW7IM88_9VIBR|nr:hypothetical protein [Vibrio barjaei]OIN28896.1 hypothetical protein AWH66_2006610 [Vibrio barjaei]